ncbi:MAG: MtrAB system histidine kinase MtrB [Actinomycetales bacterium]
MSLVSVLRPLRWWRHSLALRVVTTTVTLSLVVVALLGNALLDAIAQGLLSSRTEAALAQAGAGTVEAQRSFDAADRDDAATLTQLVDDLVSKLARGEGTSAGTEIVLLHVPTSGSDVATFNLDVASNDVDESSIPGDLRLKVRQEQSQQWRYVTMRYRNGSHVPGLAVGSKVTIQTAGPYELYYLFPLTQEQQILNLVRRTLTFAAIALLLLVGAIAWIVTRQVVRPVRSAARVAERLAAGRLEERMRVRGEDDLALLAATFNAMAASLQRQIRQLEDLSRVQRRFVSDVSHELRTPLTTVRMAADVIHEARHDFDPVVRRSAELLQAQLDRFEALLAELLEISRFDAGAAVLETERADLRLVARRVLDAAEPLADSAGSVLVLDEPDVPCEADVDPRRIERILRNLVVNALEHGEGRPVTVTVASGSTAVAVGVRDHGVGLRAGEASRVFDRFWRADPARARRTGGTGLGLSISLEDAHLHGGSLQAWGLPGQGSHFVLTLPREVGSDLVEFPLPLVPADISALPVAAGSPYLRTGREH